MLEWSESHLEYRGHALLFLLAYVFLLRLPSEALPVRLTSGGAHVEGQAVLEVREGSLELRLWRRKNRPEGSTLTRGCWCRESRATCPLHVLGPVVEGSVAV